MTRDPTSQTPTRGGDGLRRLGLETIAALAVPLGIAAVLRWPSRKGGKRAMIGPSGWVCTKGCARRPGYRGEHCEHHPAS